MTVQVPAFAEDGRYSFWNLRMMMGALAVPGPCNPAYEMIVSPASGLQVQISPGRAFVPQTVATEGSLYENGVGTVGGLYFVVSDSVANPYNNISAPVSNPRVDMVILRVYDSHEQGLSGSSFARFEWLQGVETAGATLSNLSGLGTSPPNSWTLAYVLQTVGESSIPASNIANMMNTPNAYGGDEWITLTNSANILGGAYLRWEGGSGLNRNVRLIGRLTNNTGATVTGTLATLPVTLTGNGSPVYRYAVMTTANPTTIEISTIGNVSVPAGLPDSETLSFGCTFTVQPSNGYWALAG